MLKIGLIKFFYMRRLILYFSFLSCLLFIIGACTSAPGYLKNNEKIGELIDSTKTTYVLYAYDEQYAIESHYYDKEGALLKVVKYDDLARSVIYNVRSKKATELKLLEQ
ncbi:MAG: hypothetical protein EB092_00845 [Chitinophagia bacterium]|jgi:hypothetical protein|nr:hypothetical protein [Chitinophagia bacterium]NCA30182.1 hypothetical protein [Chitinophagia bacterium]NDD15532.1 hypothetical protein [Chitinophagia bacterium]